MAAALIGGRTMLPCIFTGAFILNLWIGDAREPHAPLLQAMLPLWIAAACTLQAAAGARAFRRAIGYPMALDSARDLKLFFVISPLACLISATLSVGALSALGLIGLSDFAFKWLAWWIGDTLGVLLFVPLVMVVAGEPRGFWRSRALPVAVPVLIFFALFTALFVRTRIEERDDALAEFRLLSRGFSDRLQNQLTAQEASLEQLAASWSRPQPMTPGDFATLTAPLMRQFPWIQAVEWAPAVTRADRAAFETARQRDDPGFAIRDFSPDGGLVPSGDRETYWPVAFIQPQEGNRRAIGYDLISSPVRAAAIRETIRTGTPAATAPLSLIPKPEGRPGLLLTLFVPPGPSGEGLLVLVLRVDRFLQAALGPEAQVLNVRLVDRPANRPLFDTIGGGSLDGPGAPPIVFGGRIYDISTTPGPLYVARPPAWSMRILPVAGVLSTCLLGAVLMLGTGEQRRFARLLSERTRERDRIWHLSEDLLGVRDLDGRILSVNPAWTKTLGWSEAELRTLCAHELRHPDDAAIAEEGRQRLLAGAGTVRMENRYRHKDGSLRWIYWTTTLERGLMYVSGRDVTADRAAAHRHRQTEEQLYHLQKMESLGELTGGIAHDFNNLLTVIIGNLELLERSQPEDAERTVRAITAAMKGATRAAALTHRLLAYAQRQPLRPRATDLSGLVTGMDALIARACGDTISRSLALADNLPACFCDPAQLETALLNLVINARDAMPNGGTLRIETARAGLEGPDAEMRGLEAGDYVTLAVTDSGMGMSRQILDRAFEPFFTTKGQGKGSGLGLSMVYGFVRQSNGHVEIVSTPGQGTTVRLYLPSLAAGVASLQAGRIPREPHADRCGRGETILVVDDDPGVRSFVADTLRALNYSVIEADNAEAALAVISHDGRRINLLLTDVMMPGMNGRELADRAKAAVPDLRVMFMTGYTREDSQHARLDPDVELISKPFRSDNLAARVRAVLDRDVARAAG